MSSAIAISNVTYIMHIFFHIPLSLMTDGREKLFFVTILVGLYRKFQPKVVAEHISKLDFSY